MEKRDLYDKNRNLTGEFIFKGDPVPKGKYIIVLLVMIQNSKGEFLIQKRSKQKGGKFAATGGHVKSGQTSVQGMIDEIQEEIGLVVKPEELELLYTAREDEQDVFFDLYYMKKDIDISKLVLQEEEVELVQWNTIEEIDELIKKDSKTEKWIRKYSMGVEFINNIPRYCLWLKDIKPNELNSMPLIKKRVVQCKEWRENSVKTGDAYKLRDIPHLFRPCKQYKDVPYIAVPLVSSSARKYMPMGFIDNGMIPGNNLFSIFDASLFDFGILTSNVHMSWIRIVGGRLKSDWRYSKDIVYNNFPWPNPTDEQKTKIEKTAQAILDARAKYPESSLADLYDEVLMPADLRKAHQANDRAVMEAYGFAKDITESEIVAELFKMYENLTEGK